MSLSSVSDRSNRFPNCSSTLTSFIGVSQLNGTTALLTTFRGDLPLLKILPFPNCRVTKCPLIPTTIPTSGFRRSSALDFHQHSISQSDTGFLYIFHSIMILFCFLLVLALTISDSSVSYFSLHGRKNIQIHLSSEHQLIWAFICGRMRRSSIGF